MLTVARAVGVVGLLVFATPPLARPAHATPRPTTIHVTPVHASDGEYVTAKGIAACGDDRLMIEYETYAGNHTAYGTDWRAPTSSPPTDAGWPYTITVRVPHTAKPGTAQVYVAPYCDPEGFDASDTVNVTIDPARVRFTVTPQHPRVGRPVTITGTGCYGTTSTTAPVRVRWSNGMFTRDVPLTRPRTAKIGDGHGFAVTTTPPAGSAGTARVTLLPDADCPGTHLPADVTFDVLPAAARGTTPPPATPTRTATTTTPPAATSTPTATATPPATATAPPPTTTPEPAAAKPVSHRGIPVPAVAFPAAALLAATAFGIHRSRRASP